MPTHNKKKPQIIGVLAPPDAQPIDVSGPIGAFREANRQSNGRANYEIEIVATKKSKTIEVDGLSIVANKTIKDENAMFDTLLVAGTHNYKQAFHAVNTQRWLADHCPKFRRFGSVCTGAFFLASAGLLDSRRVTTHWQHAGELASRFPSVNVLPDAIYVKDDNLFTSAGVTAGIDLTLQLIEEDHGKELALKVARRLVVFLRRQGGQSQYSPQLAAQISGDDRIQAIQHWILENLQETLSLKIIAAKGSMSIRNFTRVFKAQTGETPADFVEIARVDAARRLLEAGESSLQRIATDCGFSNTDLMRRAFHRRLATGPSAYRARFKM